MLKSGNKFRALRDKKNNILTLVLSEKKILNETKNQFASIIVCDKPLKNLLQFFS